MGRRQGSGFLHIRFIIDRQFHGEGRKRQVVYIGRGSVLTTRAFGVWVVGEVHDVDRER